MFNPLTGLYDNREEISKSRALKNIELNEISLVDRPASKRKFLFFKSDGYDELDKLLSVLEQADFDEQSDVAITKAVDVLTGLEADERTAVAKTILAVVRLAGVDIDDDTEVKKIDYDSLKWPSFRPQLSEIEKTETTVSDDAKWPSLCGA